MTATLSFQNTVLKVVSRLIEGAETVSFDRRKETLMSLSRRKNPDPFKMPKTPKPPQAPKPPPGFKQFSKGLKGLPGPKSRPVTGLADPDVLNTIHEAIGGQIQIAATYVDEEGRTAEHVFFPLELGTKNREPRVWAYQTDGGSGEGWRCFVVGRLSNVMMQLARRTVPEEIPTSARCIDRDRAPAL